jgi:SAM-dependent methyltransferase
MLYNIEVSDEAFEHLKPQRGALWDLKDERARWLLAYQHDLQRTFGAMFEHLPPLGAKPSVLDIGAGMGGIDLLLWRRFGPGTTLSLFDQLGGEARCDRHGQPFGDLGIAHRFLVENGCDRADIRLLPVEVTEGLDDGPAFDVVLSTQAWCFHFPPQPYLGWLRGRLNPKAVVIVDLRHGRPDWLAELTEALGEPVAIVGRNRKSDLVVFRA